MRFHARLFKAAVETGLPVQPICIRYQRGNELDLEAGYLGDETQIANMIRQLINPASHAFIFILPLLDAQGQSRDILAQQANEMIKQQLTG